MSDNRGTIEPSVDSDRDDQGEADTAAEDLWPSSSLVQRLAIRPEFGVGAALILMIVTFTVLSPHLFPTFDNFRDLFLDNSTLAIYAIGMTFVLISGGIDLSGGSVVAFTQIVTAKTFGAFGAGSGVTATLVGLAVALVSGAAWGMLNGFLITRASIAPFIATLATGGIALGVADIITGGQDLTSIPATLTQDIGQGNVLGIPRLIICAAVAVCVAGYALHRTRFGRHTYAVGSDAEAAQRAGIPVDHVRRNVYALAGLTYGAVAYLDMANYGTTTIASYEDIALAAITAVALGGASLYGGVGGAIGTLIGVSIPAVLQNGLVILGVSGFWDQVGVGIALIAALYSDQLRRRVQRLA